MNNSFADWYRLATISPPAEFLEQRWLGVDEAAAKFSAAEFLELLRLIYSRRDSDGTIPDFLDAIFRKHDASLPTKNLQEMRVLAGAIVRQVLEVYTDSNVSIVVALGLMSASFGMEAECAWMSEHVGVARACVVADAVGKRNIEDAPSAKVVQISQDKFDEWLPASVFAVNATPNLRTPLLSVLNEQSLRATKAFGRFGQSLWRIIQVQREELNLLWWLQTKYSRDLNKSFSEFSVAEASLVFPSEIADLTTVIPGSTAALGLLVNGLQATSKQLIEVSIKDAVNSTPRNWREVQKGKLSLAPDRLTPILLAVSTSLETDSDEEWLPIFRKHCRVQVEAKVPAVLLAEQFYRERLFLRALAELEK